MCMWAQLLVSWIHSFGSSILSARSCSILRLHCNSFHSIETESRFCASECYVVAGLQASHAKDASLGLPLRTSLSDLLIHFFCAFMNIAIAFFRSKQIFDFMHLNLTSLQIHMHHMRRMAALEIATADSSFGLVDPFFQCIHLRCDFFLSIKAYFQLL